MSDAMNPFEIRAESTVWDRAVLAAIVHRMAPYETGGIRLRCQAGPVREAWLAGFMALLTPEMPLRRMPAQITDGRLLGGLDLAATLQAGHPVAEKGLLADAHGGFLVLAMAERIDAATAAKLASVMDRGVVMTERDGLTQVNAARFGIVALDEGVEDEHPPLPLTERMGLVVDLRDVSHREITAFPDAGGRMGDASRILKNVSVHETTSATLCAASDALGVSGVRAPLQAMQVARALAAYAGRDHVSEEDVTLAAILVLAPRATRVPAVDHQDQDQEQPDNPEPEAPTPDDQNAEAPSDDPQSAQQSLPPLEDMVLEATMASLPPELLKALQAQGGIPPARSAGKCGQIQKLARRGRVIGSKPGDMRSGARLDLIATLRHAAPWQKLRQGTGPSTARVRVRREDFHVAHYRQRAQTTTVFAVDASGSSALQRLSEAKGAVRLLLSECYVRRDEVALIAFRGSTAEIILPPTRSLVRAQRSLAALPGGGGTPIAAGLDAALSLCNAVRRSGRTPSLVIMTDGRANVCRDGQAGRAMAQEEARLAAKALRHAAVATILIDTSPKPQPLAGELAQLMGARYVPLPHANADRVAQAVQVLQASHPSPAQPARSRGVA